MWRKSILLLVLLLLFAAPCLAFRGVALVKYTNGMPNFSGLPEGMNVGYFCTGKVYNGYDLCMLSLPTKGDVDAVLALPNTKVFPVCYARDLDDVMAHAVRTKLNVYLTNQGAATIPADWTNKQFVRAYLKRIANTEDDRAVVIGDQAEDEELNPSPGGQE